MSLFLSIRNDTQDKNRMMHGSGYPDRCPIHLTPACSGSLDAEFPFHNVLDGGVDVGEILESPERDVLLFTVDDEVLGCQKESGMLYQVRL